jgi:hypothetical protein
MARKFVYVPDMLELGVERIVRKSEVGDRKGRGLKRARFVLACDGLACF